MIKSHAKQLAVFVIALLSMALAPASQPAYLAPDSFDFKTLLGGPPADNSKEHRDEVDQMLALQMNRTPEDVARCKSEEKVTVFAFSNVLGPWFNAKNLPQTAAMMARVYEEMKVDSDAVKKIWNRQRPMFADPRIHPCVTLEATPSFPSSHAARGILWGTLLSEIFPDQRDVIMARGNQIGDDRFLAGMHYPTDVRAGQKLGAEVARRLLSDAGFRDELDRVAKESRGAAIRKSSTSQ